MPGRDPGPRSDVVEHVNAGRFAVARPGFDDCVRAPMPSSFDVAISIGIERVLAERVAEKLRAAEIAVFYGYFYAEHL